MNILVVDDEYYIVKNIIETTDWSTLGIEQAFPAYSASQAKRLFEGSQDIDILLTDIEMPRETGLQLVEWLHENDFHPIVLVLTGHQRFDYAQEALNLHIFSYLLKPIDPDQLTEKLAAAVQEVKKNAWYEKERLNMEEHLSTNTSDPISVIKDYIRSHLSDPELGRTSIAEEIHMNPDYLSHIFSTKAGASLSSYIMDERMAAAKRLLATTGFSPQQICDQIGIANVLPAVQEKQRGDTAAVSGEAFSWIITSTGACLKKVSSAQKNRVYWDFSFPCTLFHFLPAKIRQILFQIILRLLQIFLPDTLHNIVMMRNVQCRVYVGPGLPVKLGVSAF